MVNNLAAKLRLVVDNYTADALRVASGLHADLYFQMDGHLYSLKCMNESVTVNFRDTDKRYGHTVDVPPLDTGNLGIFIPQPEANSILRQFF